jgi:adenosylcobinamide-GDP ribazoletransferase
VLSALTFLTVVGRSSPPGPRTFRWFPAAGALIGAVVAGTWWAAGEAWGHGSATAAAVAVGVDLALTGMLHLDGLADSADGLLPHLPRERRLAVMREPDVGAFALGLVPAVLLLRFAAFTSVGLEPWSIVAVWALSRTIAAAVPGFVPYARPGGLAEAFLGDAERWTLLAAVPAVALLAWSQGALGVGAAGAQLLAAALVVTLARARIGGFTGDVLGATILVSETAALLVLAATP